MGGNVEFEGHPADRIHFNSMTRFAVEIFKALQDRGVWSKSLFVDDVASGSTRLMFTHDEVPLVYNARFGDIDLQVDSTLGDEIFQMLLGLKNVPIFTADDFTIKLIGAKKTVMNIITLWQIGAVNVQVDLECVDFENGKPTEWARFAFSSPFNDFVRGIKGVAHKLALRALTALTLEKRKILLPSGKTKTELRSLYAFSNRGLRKSLELKPAGHWVKIPVEDSTFITDPVQISEILFGIRSRVHSFTAINTEVRTKLPAEKQQRYIAGMNHLLFGPESRPIYRNRWDDLRVKLKIADCMISDISFGHGIHENS